MKPARLSALAGIAAIASLGGCAPTPSPQALSPGAYAQPGNYGAYPQSAAGSYGQYGGAGTYGAPAGYAAPQSGYPNAQGAYGTYGEGYAAPAQGTYGGSYANGYPASAGGYAPTTTSYGQPAPAGAPNANGYYARGSGQYPPPSTFDVRQPYYGDGGYHLMGSYNDGESHPLRLVSFAVAPVGYLAEWLVARPIHRVVAQQDMAPIFSYTPQAGFDYETYEEGLSTGVTFEEPQSLD
jgi:hypothetical protein